jgi:hypothetical protein
MHHRIILITVHGATAAANLFEEFLKPLLVARVTSMMPASACVVNAFPTEGLTASNNTYAASRSNPCQWLLYLQLYFILDYTSIFECVKDIVHVDEGQTRRFTTNYLLDLTIGFADALRAPSLSLSPTAVDHGVPNSACARD